MGLHCCTRAFSCGELGPPPGAVCKLLVAVASLWSVGVQASAAATHGLSSRGTQA